uniref:7TM_GPCR_Srx domain-containing protein n=1 Tax=Steinernema glaseri TaxID=37863 RepID=A0A1I7ZC44_9BILA
MAGIYAGFIHKNAATCPFVLQFCALQRVMGPEIAIGEFAAVVLLNSSSLVLHGYIFHEKPLKVMWRESPVLTLFMVSMILLALQGGILAVQWILVAVGVIENVEENNFFLLVVGHIIVVFWHFHHCVSVALYAQRVHFLLYPTRSIKQFNYLLLAALSLVFVADTVGVTYIFAIYAKPNGKPVPEGKKLASALKYAFLQDVSPLTAWRGTVLRPGYTPCSSPSASPR